MPPFPSGEPIGYAPDVSPLATAESAGPPLSPLPLPPPPASSADGPTVKDTLGDSGVIDASRAASTSGEITFDVDVERAGDCEPSTAPPSWWRDLLRFTGPGFLMSMAYIDPGNLAGDINQGVQQGYTLIWVTLWGTVLVRGCGCTALTRSSLPLNHSAPGP